MRICTDGCDSNHHRAARFTLLSEYSFTAHGLAYAPPTSTRVFFLVDLLAGPIARCAGRHFATALLGAALAGRIHTTTQLCRFAGAGAGIADFLRRQHHRLRTAGLRFAGTAPLFPDQQPRSSPHPPRHGTAARRHLGPGARRVRAGRWHLGQRPHPAHAHGVWATRHLRRRQQPTSGRRVF